MVQVGLKPTKLGSNACAIVCLRDKSLKTFYGSVLGMVESRLCDRPIYFSYFPRNDSHHVSLSDDLSRTLSIDIKTEGSSRDENIILMYRLHYRVLGRRGNERTRNSSRYRVDENGATTLFLTDVAQSNRVLSKRISWERVAVPERWMNWKESAEAHVLKVSVNGFEKEEVKVEVEDGIILQISGQRSSFKGGLWVRRNRPRQFLCFDRGSGNFLCRLSPPENAKLDEVKVAMENDVLTVTVPKEEVSNQAQLKIIDISG